MHRFYRMYSGHEMVFPETLSIWSLFEDTQMGTDAHALLDMHNT